MDLCFYGSEKGLPLCLMNLQYVKHYKVVSFEYFLLILSAVLGLIFLCSSFDLISVYLALELQSLNFYVLASFNRESSFSIEAGLKYLILGAFSSAFFLFGTSLIYGVAGATNFEELRVFLYLTSGTVNIIQVGIFLITGSLLFKIASFPFVRL
jgi:NADH:ubiquinone oxidoreductase subunit 2 (subunit N)